ncbi:hypothetical protein GPECTOR_48g411 [Gonium pectorale]|uniref:Uncharacterized protein n=1 Tax=Gonium pectorale TaxID=33097 RepID=A0A150G807_GONPE|nr:hypothetical protein GPECTOR_48g411 [Gonium pectorale]|eukprot:KXZ45979.1 hypothetical protein GPECTOR_48g411 [Gonium pectorale]
MNMSVSRLVRDSAPVEFLVAYDDEAIDCLDDYLASNFLKFEKLRDILHRRVTSLGPDKAASKLSAPGQPCIIPAMLAESFVRDLVPEAIEEWEERDRKAPTGREETPKEKPGMFTVVFTHVAGAPSLLNQSYAKTQGINQAIAGGGSAVTPHGAGQDGTQGNDNREKDGGQEAAERAEGQGGPGRGASTTPAAPPGRQPRPQPGRQPRDELPRDTTADDTDSEEGASSESDGEGISEHPRHAHNRALVQPPGMQTGRPHRNRQPPAWLSRDAQQEEKENPPCKRPAAGAGAPAGKALRTQN